MKVRELVALMQQEDPDAEVFRSDNTWGAIPIVGVEHGAPRGVLGTLGYSNEQLDNAVWIV